MRRFRFILSASLSLSGLGCGSAEQANSSNVNRQTIDARSENYPAPGEPRTDSASSTANAAVNRPLVYKEEASKALSNTSAAPQSKLSEKTVRISSDMAANSNGKPPPLPAPRAQTPEKKEDGLFSFPPPKVISFTEVARRKFLNNEGPTTLATVSQKLSSGLEKGGYSTGRYGYFWNSDNEFAIITAMERVDAMGRPVGDSARWGISDNLPKARNFSEYLTYLVSGRTVYYRVLAFVVTNKDYGFFDGTSPSFNMARHWMQKGKRTLGGAGAAPAIREIVFDEQYHCYALLYLFVDHTSLDYPKPVDELETNEAGLRIGLDMNIDDHMQQTNLTFGD